MQFGWGMDGVIYCAQRESGTNAHPHNKNRQKLNNNIKMKALSFVACVLAIQCADATSDPIGWPKTNSNQEFILSLCNSLHGTSAVV